MQFEIPSEKADKVQPNRPPPPPAVAKPSPKLQTDTAATTDDLPGTSA